MPYYRVNSFSPEHSGFSLVELTIVLVVIALLSGGLMLKLSNQHDQVLNKDAQQQLDQIRDALVGFAMTTGRLPCPAEPSLATDAGAGNEAKSCDPADCSTSDRVCSLEQGVIPWLALGVKETDPWGTRFTYFVSKEFSNPLKKADTDAGKRARFTMETDGKVKIKDGAKNEIADKIPAVIISHGSRPAGGFQPNGKKVLPDATGDEAENLDADDTIPLFIADTPTESFDDLVTWIAPTVLKARMVAAGRLP